MTSPLGSGIRDALDRLTTKGLAMPQLDPEQTQEQQERCMYLSLKEHWYFHDSSWYFRGLDDPDGFGCTQEACIAECPYRPATGRVVGDEHGSRILYDDPPTAEHHCTGSKVTDDETSSPERNNQNS